VKDSVKLGIYVGGCFGGVEMWFSMQIGILYILVSLFFVLCHMGSLDFENISKLSLYLVKIEVLSRSLFLCAKCSLLSTYKQANSEDK